MWCVCVRARVLVSGGSIQFHSLCVTVAVLGEDTVFQAWKTVPLLPEPSHCPKPLYSEDFSHVVTECHSRNLSDCSRVLFYPGSCWPPSFNGPLKVHISLMLFTPLLSLGLFSILPEADQF